MTKRFILKVITFLISLIDYFNKKKIINFFQKKFNKKKLKIIDIGAHKGETIELFIKNFVVDKIYAFEPNIELYKELSKKSSYKKENINIYNYGVGLKKEKKNINIMIDSSSSTLNDLNKNTDYYKRKMKFFSFIGKKEDFIKKKQEITLINLSDFIFQKENSIDILKIDTEGYEFNILSGMKNQDFDKVSYIYFEHHYDLMIKKGYKFSEINYLLKKNNFKQKLKLKMKFRKSFEYIYESKKKSLASIIVVNYNNAKYLKYSISSAINQSYKNKEVIVVDDKSTDNSIKVLNSYKDKIKVIRIKKNDRKNRLSSEPVLGGEPG